MAAAQAPQSAFVTGGSGFIGKRLIRRLVDEGSRVAALARSEAAAAKVREAGAEPVRGDLHDVGAMRAGADRCEVAFHAAAVLGEWGPWEHFERGNVTGTRNAIEACRAAGVRRFVHVGTEAALLDGTPLVDVDETAPLKPDSKAVYSRSKALAERAVVAANGEGIETVVLRPRLVWGPGDTTILPSLVESVRKGRFAWIGGGIHRTSTTHVDNAVEGLLLAAARGRAGEPYFVTDGDPVVFREFITRLLATQGVTAPDKTVSPAIARLGAAVAEGTWRVLGLRGTPPITRLALWLASLECTIDISKARRDLGYRPVVSVDEGLQGLSAGWT
jgi:nucleoside-diphosphate-sugar epimerase